MAVRKSDADTAPETVINEATSDTPVSVETESPVVTATVAGEPAFRGKAHDAEPPAAVVKSTRTTTRTTVAAAPPVEYVDEIGMDELTDLRQTKTDHEAMRAKMAAAETELRDAHKRVKTFEREKLSEDERKQAELNDALARVATVESQLKTARATQAVTAEATKLGMPIELAVELLASKVAFDDDGTPINVEQTLRALAQKHPQLVAPRGASASNPEKVGGRGAKAGLTRADIEGMDEREINERWDEIGPLLATFTA